MSWPLSQDFNEAVQNPATCLGDEELRRGEAATNALGLPVPRSGNFADVYQFHCPGGRSWAVKCFTREVPGLCDRYRQISRRLRKARLPFIVEFSYLEQGIRVRGQWYPVVKMPWVEGFALNEFVRSTLDRPSPTSSTNRLETWSGTPDQVSRRTLDLLLQIWGRMGRRLREAGVAHCDLQHGNVLLVPGRTATALAVRLIDYDGLFVPALAEQPSGEAGHASYQHPQRLQALTYSPEVDRFPLLLIATALRCLAVGGAPLWQRYDNGDNLLFREADLQAPGGSALFRDLWALDDWTAHVLVGRLALACQGALEEAPLLDEVLPDGRTPELDAGLLREVEALLGPGAQPARPRATAVSAVLPGETSADEDFATLAAGGRTGRRHGRHGRGTGKLLAIGGAVGGAVAALVIGFLLTTGGPGKDSGDDPSRLARNKTPAETTPPPPPVSAPVKEQGPPPAAKPVAFTPPRFGRPRLSWTGLAGLTGVVAGDFFDDVPEEPAVLTGLTVTLGTGASGPFVKSVQPHFTTPAGEHFATTVRGEPGSKVEKLLAREGYAVGALVCRENGFRVVFHRLAGTRLDPSKNYSLSVGGKTGPEKVLGGDGRPVVGLHGRAGTNCEALGLVLLGRPHRTPPSPAEVVAAEKKIQEEFRAELARTEPTELRSLAQKMADLEDGSPARRFALLRKACELALRAGDLDLARRSADEATREHDTGPAGLLLAGMQGLIDKVPSGPAAKLGAAALRLFDDTLTRKDLDGARRSLVLGEAFARKASSFLLFEQCQARQQLLDEVRREAVQVRPALEVLRGRPDDPQANLAAGTYFALTLGDWDGGLPLLASAADSPLQALARHDLDGGATAARQAADGWWQLAATEPEPRRRNLLSRAWRCYHRARHIRSDALRLQVEERLARLKELLGETVPLPRARWTFAGEALDQVDGVHGRLEGSARVALGRLRLDGPGDGMRTPAFAWELKEKTLEAWVTVAGTAQAKGHVFDVVAGSGSPWDGIVFGLKQPGRWAVGSSSDHRSSDGVGPVENARPEQLVHLAAVYRADHSIALYRNGKPHGPPLLPAAGPASTLQVFKVEDWHVRLGFNLGGEIQEARLYDRPLGREEIEASYQEGLFPLGKYRIYRAGDLTRGPNPDGKREAPPAAVQEEIRALVHNLFRVEYARTEAAALQALAGKLLRQGRDLAAVDPLHGWADARFVLLEEARAVATRAADVALVCRAIDELAESHAIDGRALKTAALSSAAATAASPPQREEVARLTLSLCLHVLTRDDYDRAARLAGLADKALAGDRASRQVKQYLVVLEDVRAILRAYQEARGPLARLRDKPDDPAANAAAGKFRCLIQGAWDRGLPLLLKGDDGPLKALAQQDLARPVEAAQRLKVGEAWSAHAARILKGPEKTQLLRRALYWHRLALASLEGPPLLAAEKQADLIAAALPAPALLDAPDAPGELHRLEMHGAIAGVGFAADGRQVVGAADDGTVRFWEVVGGKEVRRLDLAGLPGGGQGVAVLVPARDGVRAVLGHADLRVGIWDLVAGKELHRCFAAEEKEGLRSVALAPDHRLLAVCGDGQTVRLWNVVAGKEGPPLVGHTGSVHDIAFAPSGGLLVSGGSDKTVRVWNLATGRELTRFSPGSAVERVRFLPDSRHVVCGCGDGSLQLWDYAIKGKPRRFEGRGGAVRGLAVAPDGRRILSAGRDGELRLWDVANGKEVWAGKGHEGEVRWLAFAPDGRRAVSGGSDQTVRIWVLPE